MNTRVNHTVAKLLKEKGYGIDEKSNSYFIKGAYYDESGKLFECGTRGGIMFLFKGKYSAPTIIDVIMWLYNHHKLWISVDVLGKESYYGEKNGKYIYIITKIINGEVLFNSWCNVNKNGNSKPLYYKSPIETYSFGIEYTLNNLI